MELSKTQVRKGWNKKEEKKRMTIHEKKVEGEIRVSKRKRKGEGEEENWMNKNKKKIRKKEEKRKKSIRKK